MEKHVDWPMSESQQTQDLSDNGNAASPTPFRSPVQFLAFGFGSGLSPVAPGTAGTVAAVVPYLLLAQFDLLTYSVLVLIAFGVGVYLCGEASKQLGVHDHPGIVWDEFVGLWIALWAVPATPLWIVAGFIAFRVFDIAKPWPIGALDKRVHGGFGIMIDDILAGVFACLVLHLAMYLAGAAL